MKCSFALAALLTSTLASVGQGMDLCGAGYSAGNTNYYQAFTAGSFTWIEARDYAAMKTFCGVTGHLVTITSGDENSVVSSVVSQCATSRVSWIGLSDHVSEGTFQWVTGEPFGYDKWCGPEPNNQGNEDYVEVLISNGCWNDINLSGYGNVDKFVVEFDNVPVTCPDHPDYEAPPEVEGDPHFHTFNGTWYDYMGVCDMILLDAPKFDEAAPLRVQIRTTGRYEYSYVESAAVQIGDSILEVGSFGTYFLDGVEGAKLSESMDGKSMAGKYPITHTQINDKTSRFMISLGGKEAIVISTFKDLVSVKLDELDNKRFAGSRGMLGDYDSGKTTTRDGSVELSDPDVMAAEWQVRPEEDGMFFQTARSPQYPEACRSAGKGGLRVKNKVGLQVANQACAHLSGFQQEACVHDVISTGDSDLAASF